MGNRRWSASAALVVALAAIAFLTPAAGWLPAGTSEPGDSSASGGSGTAGATTGPGSPGAGRTTPAAATEPYEVRLDKPVNGPDAVRTLGPRLGEVAREHGIPTDRLRTTLLTDESVWVSRSGRLYVIEPPVPGITPATPVPAPASAQASAQASAPASAQATTPTTAGPTTSAGDDAPVPAPGADPPQPEPADPIPGDTPGIAEAPFPYDQTFLLHSKPGSQRTIYLDFDGHTVSGTQWNIDLDTPGSVAIAPYDTDGSPASFSNAEREVIQAVWQRVAEDYAPFDVDVTTQAPAAAAITRANASDQVYGTRVVISPTSFVFGFCGCGGAAYVGSFDIVPDHTLYQPAFVLTRGVGNGAKEIAEAAAHEAGHTLGLFHHGFLTTPQVDNYYAGQGAWAPIMGAGYLRAITHWSNGDYANANRPDQSDVTEMAKHGAVARSDDHGNTTGTATVLGSSTTSATGIITTRTDVDVFRVTAPAGLLSVTAIPAPVGANLDIKLDVLNSSGAVIATASPASGQASASVATGLSATVSLTVGAGTYYIRVDGVGSGNPLTTGYSDYGSLGPYEVTIATATAATYRTQELGDDRCVAEPLWARDAGVRRDPCYRTIG